MTSPYTSQLVYAYETLDLTPSEIAEQFSEAGITYEEVIAILGDNSARYRAALNEKASINSSNNEEDFLREYRILARSASNELVRERALKFLINESKGRNDIASETLILKRQQLGLNAVNTAARAREFIDEMKRINERLQATFPATVPQP